MNSHRAGLVEWIRKNPKRFGRWGSDRATSSRTSGQFPALTPDLSTFRYARLSNTDFLCVCLHSVGGLDFYPAQFCSETAPKSSDSVLSPLAFTALRLSSMECLDPICFIPIAHGTNCCMVVSIHRLLLIILTRFSCHSTITGQPEQTQA